LWFTSVVVAAATALVAFVAYHWTTSSPRLRTLPHAIPRSSNAAPSEVRLPVDVRRPSAHVHGVSDDGWASQDASVTLAGGGAGELMVRGEAPAVKGQHLQVVMNGRLLGSAAVPSGPLDLRFAVPASATKRRIELRFARTIRLRPPDERRAAARLFFIGIGSEPRGPRVLKFPSDLSLLTTEGVYADGWVQQHARFSLAGGSAGDLVVRGEVPVDGQRLDVLVDGSEVSSSELSGPIELHVPVPGSRENRQIILRFRKTIRLRPPDARSAAARLTFVGVRKAHPYTRLTIPDGLARVDAAYSGIFPDGWAEPKVRVLMTGGPAADISVTTETLVDGQRLQVIVNGRLAKTLTLPVGASKAVAPVAASRGARVVVLRFARAARIAANDRRLAAGRLRMIMVEPRHG
jgi:hypothetical protein